MPAERIELTGIHGITGASLFRPISRAEAVATARAGTSHSGAGGWFRFLRDRLLRSFEALPLDVEPTDLRGAGWGIVFPRDAPERVRSAMEPLIAWRRRAVPEERCRILEYRSGETMRGWLRRHGVGPGTVCPYRVPYYLLLVGGPEAIPFEFQSLLDIEYAVGRLAFDDPDGYGQYVASVCEYESASAVPHGREILFWGPRREGDRALCQSADALLSPLLEGLSESGPDDAGPFGFRRSALRGRYATRAALLDVLTRRGARPAPAFLFTASHGLGWPVGHPHQRPAQGALLSQDWPGVGPPSRNQYVAGADLGPEAHLHGLVAFLFACYGAGTPVLDSFPDDRSRDAAIVAEVPFVSALAQRMLSHPNGAALAVIGHVDRAWGCSFQPPGLEPQLVPFRNLIARILRGEPVGHATRDLSERVAILSAALGDDLEESRAGSQLSADEIAWTWIERNDARNTILLGDPAVRLRVDRLR